MTNSRKFKENELPDVAQFILTQLKGKQVLLLSGDLGTGKTTLTKAILKALGYEGLVTSPTYTLVNIYTLNTHPPNPPLYSREGGIIESIVHGDLYRLDTDKAIAELDLMRYLTPNTLMILEWADKLPEGLIEVSTLYCQLQHCDSDTRELRLF